MSGYFKRMAQLARASSTPPKHSRLPAKPTGNKMISSMPAQLSKDAKTSNITASSPRQSTTTTENKNVSTPSSQVDIAEKNHESPSNDIPAPSRSQARKSITEPIKRLSGDALSRRTVDVDDTERTKSLRSPKTPSVQAVDAQSERKPSVNPFPPKRVKNPVEQRHRETHLSEQSSQRVASPVNLTPDERGTTASHNSLSMPLSLSNSVDHNSDSEGIHTASLKESTSADKVAAFHPQEVKPEKETAAPSAYRVAPHHAPALTPPPAPPQQSPGIEVNIGAISLSLDPEPMAKQVTAAQQPQSAPVSSASGIWSSRRTLARSYVRRV